MGKKINFGADADYYYNRGIDKAEEGKDIEAISDFYLSLELDPGNIYTMSEMAYSYYELGLTEQAIKIYYRILDADRYSDIAYIGLMQCFVRENRIVSALYYLNMGLEYGALDTDYLPTTEITEEQQQTAVPPELRVLHAGDKTGVVGVARTIAASGDYKVARKMLEEVSEKSEQYIDAGAYLSFLSLAEGNYEECEAKAKEVLAKDPKNACAYCSLIVSCLSRGDVDAAESYMYDLDAVDVQDKENVMRVAGCMAEIGNDELCAKYFGRLFDITPYEPDSTLMYALALFNLHKRDDARSYMTALRRLYPDNGTIAYYARLMNEPNVNHIKLNVSIPRREIQNRIKYIDERFAELGDAEKVADAMFDDEELYEDVMWLLFSNEYSLASHIGSFLCQDELWQPFILDRLIDPDVPPAVKKDYLLSYLKYSKIKKFSLLVGDVMLFFSPRMPKCSDDINIQDAYWNAYATCAFVTQSFQSKLNKIYKKIAEATVKPGFKSDEVKSAVLAAVMTRLSGAHSIFYDKESCCGIFDIEKRDYDEYIKRFGLEEEEAAAEKRLAAYNKKKTDEHVKRTEEKENKQ